MVMLVNTLTGLRLMLSVIVFDMILCSQATVLILCIFGLIGATDWLDGRLARRFKAETRAGAVFDVVADMAFMVLSFTALIAQGLLPVMVLGLLFYKFIEFILTSYVARRRSQYKGKVLMFDPVGRMAALLFYILPTATVLSASLMASHAMFLLLLCYLSLLAVLVCISSLQRIRRIVNPVPQM